MSLSNGGIKKRIMASILAVAVTASIFGTVLYIDGTKAHAAKVTLRGIQELANTHSEGGDDSLNPLIVVEVVESKANAKLGYLVGGEEPVGADAKSIKDMPSSTERLAKLPTATPTYLEGAAYTWAGEYNETAGTVSMDIRGSFEDVGAGNGDYEESGAGSGYQAYADAEKADGSKYDTDADGEIDEDELPDINADGLTIYRNMHYYYLSDISGFEPWGDEDFISDSTVNDGTDPIANAYNSQSFAIDKTIGSFEDFSVDDRVFRGVSGADLEYKGTITSNSRPDGSLTRTIDGSDGNTVTVTYLDDNTIDSVSGTMFGIDFSTYDFGDEDLQLVKASESGIYRIADGSASGGYNNYDAINGSVSNYTMDNCPVSLGKYYVGTASQSDYSYVGAGNGDKAFRADYTQGKYETFSYNGGFTNDEWFKRYVLDRDETEEYEKLSIDVITVTADELTADLLAKTDLIYFNYIEGANANNDLSGEVAKAIVDGVKASNLSVMMEYATYPDAEAGGTTNLRNMALDLMQTTVSAKGTIEAGDYVIDAATIAEMQNTLWFGNKTPGTEDISYVNGTVFVNDNLVCGSIVGNDFSAIYESSKLALGGFDAIKQENEAEARYIEQQGIDVSGFNKDVSKATSIRYILNKNKNRVVTDKDKLRILDIEPYDSSQYDEDKIGQETEDNPLYQLYTGNRTDSGNRVRKYERRDIMTKQWVKDNLGFTKGDANISINQIGTKEFVAITEDLNSDYDLIYIGMDKAMLNTEISGDTKTDGETKFNRSALNGYVYTHVGDQFSGFDNVRFGTPRNATVVSSGNDITPNKVRELQSYIKAGYAVILSDGFFDDNDKLNTETVDKSSRMYELMDWLFNGDGKQYLGRNVMKRGDLDKTLNVGGADTYLETFSTFLNISRLDFVFVKDGNDKEIKPTEYDGSTSETRSKTMLEQEADGEFYLRFKVELSNNSAIDTGTENTYDCRLYIDMDADGNYESIEQLDGLDISGASESDGHFNLTTGKTYDISRIVPEGYVGFLPWKLEFVQNGSPSVSGAASYVSNQVRTSKTGFSAVPLVADFKPVINVLQIVSDDQDPTYVTEDRGGTNNLNLADDAMVDLYRQINEFDVKVYQTNADKYIRKEQLANLNGAGYFHGTYYDFLAQFDIVVLGFCDNFQFCSPQIDTAGSYNLDGTVRTREAIYKDAALGIREYAMSGRSMLFTHDLTHSSQEYVSSYDRRLNSGYYLTYYLRDIMGMDRYGYTVGKVNFNYGFDSTNEIKVYKVLTDKSTYGDDKDAGDTYGFTDSLIVTRLRPNNGNGYNNGEPNVTYALGAKRSFNAFQLSPAGNGTIQSINRGQITEYPYYIPEEAEVAPTHSQYYQLNMDTDNTDEFYDDDVVVWYALSNDDAQSGGDERFYRANYKDGRNNYYIYTKGNITYTGAGHSMIGSDRDAERKLFVNTLVASYSAGAHSPKVIYKENPWKESATITSTYVPYDPELIMEEKDDATESTDDGGGFLDDELVVNFRTMNSNIRSGSKGLHVKYYIQDNTGPLVISGKHYTEIAPTSIVQVTDGVKTNADPNLLSNFRIYQATFRLSDVAVANVGNNSTIKQDSAVLYIRVGLDDLGEIEGGSLPADESMNPLNIFATRLFDLE